MNDSGGLPLISGDVTNSSCEGAVGAALEDWGERRGGWELGYHSGQIGLSRGGLLKGSTLMGVYHDLQSKAQSFAINHIAIIAKFLVHC